MEDWYRLKSKVYFCDAFLSEILAAMVKVLLALVIGLSLTFTYGNDKARINTMSCYSMYCYGIRYGDNNGNLIYIYIYIYTTIYVPRMRYRDIIMFCYIYYNVPCSSVLCSNVLCSDVLSSNFLCSNLLIFYVLMF